MKLLGIGSKLDGATVVALTQTTVVLDDGRRMPFTEVESKLGV